MQQLCITNILKTRRILVPSSCFSLYKKWDEFLKSLYCEKRRILLVWRRDLRVIYCWWCFLPLHENAQGSALLKLRRLWCAFHLKDICNLLLTFFSFHLQSGLLECGSVGGGRTLGSDVLVWRPFHVLLLQCKLCRGCQVWGAMQWHVTLERFLGKWLQAANWKGGQLMASIGIATGRWSSLPPSALHLPNAFLLP